MENKLNLKNMISYSEGGVTSKVIIKSDVLNVTFFCMAAGTDISEHTSTKEGTVQMLEGKGIFTLAGKQIEMKPGVLIHMAANLPHSIAVEDNTSFLLTLVK